MPRATDLDRQWQELMSLCATEKELRTDRRHPKLLQFVTRQIDRLASEMGFSEHRIATRDFRAERDGAHITRVLTD